MTDSRNVIPAGPGFIGTPDHPNDYCADVELELVYGPSGDTAASLILRTIEVEAPMGKFAIGVELTAGDLTGLRGWIDGMLLAYREDTAT